VWDVYYPVLHKYNKSDHILVFLRFAEHMGSLLHIQKFAFDYKCSESLYEARF
jgi:hypothetical protein